jgi:putative transposase
MARPLRIEYPGAWYHVMNRGVCRREVFHAEEYAQLFYELLDEIHKRYQIEIHAYCLMGNHYHLCIRTPIANLGKAMRQLNGVFTQRYNNLVKGDGPLFRGRYKAILVEEENYFLTLTRYIHLNPVEAGIVEDPRDYRWSSYRQLFTITKKPTWLYFNETLKYFGASDPVSGYEKFVLEGTDIETKSFFNKKNPFPILGSKKFIEQIKYSAHSGSVVEIPDALKVIKHNSIAIDDIVNAVNKYYGVKAEFNAMRFPKKIKTIHNKVGIYLAIQLSGKSQTVVAKYFNNISYPWVSKIYHRVQAEIKTDLILLQDIDQIKANLYKIKT